MANLTTAESEDVASSFAAIATGTVYYGIDFTFSALPTAGGSYFVHFKDAASTFRGRIVANTTGAASGSFRVNIGNTASTASTTTAFPLDLALNTTYRAVVETNVVSGVSILYINPTSQTGGVTAADTAGAFTAAGMGLRQASGIGTSRVDNLIVATTFNEAANLVAVPETSALLFGCVVCGLVGVKAFGRKKSA